ncbi:MAG: hypothetical protein GNW80_06675 [Asgard group archaeon]|nr:hypothetical protein [Asgard group archaeon]
MMKNFSQFFSYVQMLGDIENREESEAFQKRVQTILENMKDISRLTLFLLREAPKETEKIVENMLTSLKKIASKYDIQLELEEKSDD